MLAIFSSLSLKSTVSSSVVVSSSPVVGFWGMFAGTSCSPTTDRKKFMPKTSATAPTPIEGNTTTPAPTTPAYQQVTLSGYKYKYYNWPAGSHQLLVEVKGDRDANIMFSPCDSCQGYRVLIGGWANTKSFIRDKGNDESVQTLVQTPGILSTTEFRRFIITMTTELEEFTIKVRKYQENESFLEKTWKTNSLPWPAVNFVSFSAYTGNPMYFRFGIQ